MWSSDSDRELPVAAAASADDSSSTTTDAIPPPSPTPATTLRTHRGRRTNTKKSNTAVSDSPRDAEADSDADASLEPEAEDVWRGAQWEAAWLHPKKPVVLAEDAGSDGVGRSRSLTDDDLEELKGCADLGFGFSYDEIPELRGTLPALELCYSMSQRLLDDDQPEASPAPVPPVTNWNISSPGDSPDEVKARLKYWAQAVACTVRLCS